MKQTTITCDRCGNSMADESMPVENLYIRIGGHNYAEDDICSDKDLCRSCIGSVRTAIVAVLAPLAREARSR
jgi:hypothetical protein